MMKTTLTAALLGIGLALAGLTTTEAEASTVLIDQGSFTYDPASGLDWLDLTATVGLSTSDVLNNIGTSYIADGWRYASFSEVLGLNADAGITLDLTDPLTYLSKIEGGVDGATNGLLQLLGEIGGSGQTEGYFKDTPDGKTGLAYISITSPLGDGTIVSISHVQDEFADAVAQSDIAGSFLVRSHVTDVTVTPLPAALPMFAAATGLMGLMGWKRKKNNAA